MRGLDPLFRFCTIPPLAWLPLRWRRSARGQPSAIFVIFITRSGRSSTPRSASATSAGLPQRRRRAAQSAGVLRQDHVPAAAPYIFTGLRIGIGFVLPSSPLKC
jgi:nitrate/nitrite transport system permease protein